MDGWRAVSEARGDGARDPRQVDVHEDDVGTKLVDEPQGRLAVTPFADDLAGGTPLDDRPQRLSPERVVVDHDHRRGVVGGRHGGQYWGCP